ncbi:MAG: hypothetical protein ACR2OU_07845, partial [Thermomicrobiales bacterium]
PPRPAQQRQKPPNWDGGHRETDSDYGPFWSVLTHGRDQFDLANERDIVASLPYHLHCGRELLSPRHRGQVRRMQMHQGILNDTCSY